MMKNYLFETCTVSFNWNKLMRKNVYLVGYSHVYTIMQVSENVKLWTYV
jgi:hypothetical protein